jgi:hypothetical protein
MTQISDIKLIRLNTGEDIIANCIMDEENGLVTIGNPMKVIVKRINEKGQSMLIMMPWLPLELVEEDLATINYNDIITVVAPKKSFVEYYFNTVEQYQELIEQKEQDRELEFGDDEIEDVEETTDEVLEEMLELIKDKKKHSIH